MNATAVLHRCRTTLPALTDRLSLGDRGLRVSPVCVGIVGTPATILAAFDAGINFFFVSADMHWPLYEPMRLGLKELLARGRGIREQVVVAGVSYPAQPDFCVLPFLELINAVPGLESLDVLLAGGAYGDEFPARLGVFAEHRRSQFVGCRAIGASFHDRQAARQAVNEGLVDIALVRYNAAHAGARFDLFPHLAPRPRPLLFNFKSTLGKVPPARFRELGLERDGFWQPEITDHYRFAMSRPELDGLLVAPAIPGHVEALARALEEGPLDQREEQHLMDLAAVAGGVARPVGWDEG
jgi:hypothetical protein